METDKSCGRTDFRCVQLNYLRFAMTLKSIIFVFKSQKLKKINVQIAHNFCKIVANIFGFNQ